MSYFMWSRQAQGIFNKLIKKTPAFIRSVVKDKVSKKAESFAQENNREQVEEKDVVDAFFAETPFGFHGAMKCDMEEFGINYEKYGYER
ncbi:MAG: PCP reductase family protein [Candidatus Omnitrophica bacterium]|nr:PCP reductase family protein [Candidatus Omnitrophota bacterium]